MNVKPRSKIPPGSLPMPLGSFIGREREIREVIQLLSAHRLVALTGAGGSGKTRLSVKVAHELQGKSKDAPGVYVLHAWVWKDNPSGIFKGWNPNVSCP